MKRYLGIVLLACLGLQAMAATYNYPTLTENGKTYYLYSVQKSEGLYAISQHFGIPQALIIEANPGCENGLILGQSLKIPVAEVAKTSASTVQQTAQTTAAPSNTPTKVFKQHLVEPKETLYGLSKQYGITVDELLKYNPWATHLTIGAVLQIPTNDPVPVATSTPVKATATQPAQKTVVAAKETPEVTPSIAPRTTHVQSTDIAEDISEAFENQALAEGQEVVPQESKFKKWARRAFKKKKDKKTTTDDIFNVETTLQDTLAADTTLIIPEQKKQWKFRKPVNRLDVAILLPFSLKAENRDASMDRFIEFYQGCILAFDSLAQTGFTVNVNTYDIGRTPAKLDSVLAIPQLKKAQLLIGPAYQSQVPAVAKFAQANKINTVIPFASNIPDITTNPYLFEVVTPQKHLSLKISQKFCYYFHDKEVVLVIPSSVVAHNKYEFTQLLEEGMNKTGMQYTTISDDNITAYTDSIAALTENELIMVVPSSNEVMLNKLGESLSLLKQPNIALLGLPEWNNMRIDELYSIKMYNFTSYQTRFQDPEITRFFTQLTQKFGLPNRVQQAPNYALFGFDICTFFLHQIQENGIDFAPFLPKEETSGLQMNFLFEQVQNGGYWNQGVILQSIDENGIQDITD